MKCKANLRRQITPHRLLRIEEFFVTLQKGDRVKKKKKKNASVCPTETENR